MLAFASPMFLLILASGVLFGALAAASAYVISYAEYRRRWLRPDQNPRQMALHTATVAFIFFVVAAIALAFFLGRGGQ